MDLGYVLAGGFGMAGDAYAKDQAAQRKFKIEQKTQDADSARQENFARFNFDLKEQGAVNQDVRALAQYKEKKTVDNAYDKSGYIDPQTKKELTNQEVDMRGGMDGLIPTADYATQQKGDALREQGDKDKEHDLDKARQAVIDGDITEADFQKLKKKSLGLTAPERSDDEKAIAREKRTAVKNAKTNVKRESDRLRKDGVDSEIAEIIALNLEMGSAYDEDTVTELRKSPNARKAKEIPLIAEGISKGDFHQTEDRITKEWKKGRFTRGDKKIAKSELDLAIKYMDAKGWIKDSKWYVPND